MTRKFLFLAPLTIAALGLTGCDWFNSATGTRSTTMRNVEILPGTASDEMVTLDQAAAEGTAIDPSVATAPVAANAAADVASAGGNAAAAGDGNSASEAASAGNASDDAPVRDTVIRPPAATPGAVAK